MNTLSLILSSKVRAEIFRILFGIETKELHLREIERKTGFAIGTVRQETSKLLKIGLINKRKDGNRTYFSANRNHPIFNEIHNIVLKTSGLADVLRNSLDHSSIQFAFIFGSLANGTESPESDIDLFIIGTLGLRAVSKFLKEPSNKFGREINTITMTEKEFIELKMKKDHFVSKVLDSQKIMIIGTENELEKLGR